MSPEDYQRATERRIVLLQTILQPGFLRENVRALEVMEQFAAGRLSVDQAAAALGLDLETGQMRQAPTMLR